MADHYGEPDNFTDHQYDEEMPENACCDNCSHASDDVSELFCFFHEKYVDKNETCNDWDE